MYGVFRVSRSWSLLVVSLLVVLLFSSLFVGIFMDGVNGASLTNAVYVKNEEELRTAINNVFKDNAVTIALDNDVILTETLRISGEKDVTLTSNRANGFYKLVGSESKDTIYIENGGVLRIDGIIVTHAKGASGSGITVYASNPALSITVSSSYLYMYSGEISGNTDDSLPGIDRGGGVYVGAFCFFELYGGKISGNKATRYGGGVDNSGRFTMFGGEISGNTAEYGGGVSSGGLGYFKMSGGKISGNAADYGGGVCVLTVGGFNNVGGVISGNTARYVGNDVCISKGDGVYVDGGDGGVSSGSGGGSEAPDGGGSSGGDDGGDVNNGQNNGGSSGGWRVFSFRDGVFIGVGVALVVVGVVVAVLLFSFKSKWSVEAEM